VKDDSGQVYLQWKTGYEVRNLGFNLYREVGGQRTLLNHSPIAGSALLGRAGTAFTAGFSYAWMDAPAVGVGKAATTYLLEDIDVNGKRVMHGPISPIPGGKLPAQAQALLLSQLQTNAPATTEQRQFLPGSASTVTQPVNNPGKGFGKGAPLSAGLQTQWDIASQPGVKLLINKTGWYRVTQSELVAAGFDVTRAPSFLQLYVDGQEIPFRVNGGNFGRLAAGDSIEFYARAIDTTYTNQRAYYLINGTQAGRRIPVVNGDGGDESRAASFDTTVERRDRSIYFAGLKNGETENWFGAIITGTPVSQTLKVAHLDAASAREATLEIALQGVFDDENVWPDHAVKVLFNGEEVGTMSFDGQQRPVSQFTFSGKLLQEGDNTVTLQSLNGSMDINLIDYVRLTYAHRFEADNDALLYTANGRELVQISGFSTANVRVYDLTDPGNITELQGNVQPTGKTYRVTVAAPDEGPRILYAVGEKALQPVAAAVANQPSSWNKLTQGADVLIITHKDFLSTVAPLKALRQSQGYSVAVVDVEALFNEFSFGARTPQAVKDFLTRAAAWKKVPRYAVLVGDASYDPKNYLGLGANDFVPTRMIDTLEMEAASDDSLGDLDDDDVSEFAIGRLPVRTATEAALTIQKIISYEQEGRPEGALLVSDRNDGYDFEGTNAGVKSLLPGGMTVGEVKRSQMTDPGAHQAIVDWINRGPKVVNYAGHGSFGLWRGNLLVNADTAQMRNGANLPFVITMTCLNGQYNTPYGDSLAEALIKADGGGALAVWASSSLTAANSQPDMDQELIRQLFTGFSATGNRLTFGEAVRRAKLMTVDSDIRRSWILFGDPTTRLK